MPPAAEGTARRETSPKLTERSLSYLVRQAHRAFVRKLGVKLEPYGISVAEWAVLRVLWQDEGMTQVDLAQRMKVQKASLTAVLSTLERKGCVAKVWSETDKRKSHLFLTDAGRALEEQILPYGLENNDLALIGVNPRDAEIARRVLEQAIANLESDR